MNPSDLGKLSFKDFKDNIIGTGQKMLLDGGSLLPTAFVITKDQKGVMVVLPDMPSPTSRHAVMREFGKMLTQRLGENNIKWFAFISEVWVAAPADISEYDKWMETHDSLEDFPGRGEGLCFAFWDGSVESIDFPMIRDDNDKLIALGKPFNIVDGRSGENYLMQAILEGAGLK